MKRTTIKNHVGRRFLQQCIFYPWVGNKRKRLLLLATESVQLLHLQSKYIAQVSWQNKAHWYCTDNCTENISTF